MKYRISTPNERVWCTTQLAKLSFNHPIGRTHSWRFSFFHRIRLWNVANVLYEPLRRPDRTVFVFAWTSVNDKIFREIWTSLDQKYIRRKKGNQPRRSRFGVDTHNMCAKLHFLLKSAWTFRHFIRNSCILRSTTLASNLSSYSYWRWRLGSSLYPYIQGYDYWPAVCRPARFRHLWQATVDLQNYF